MNRKEMLNLISGLSHSQGSYGRLLETLNELKANDPESYEEILTTWEGCKFASELAFIGFIECEPVDIWSVRDVLRWRKDMENYREFKKRFLPYIDENDEEYKTHFDNGTVALKVAAEVLDVSKNSLWGYCDRGRLNFTTDTFDPTHTKWVTLISLYELAKEKGW